jgi:hypothetical protein
MKILLIGNNSWDDTNSLGNTLTNFFSGWDGNTLSYLYSRKTPPNNGLCSHYFSIPEIEIIKNYFMPERIGYEYFYYESNKMHYGKKAIRFEKSVVKIKKIFNLGIINLMIDWAWLSKKWYNKKYINFVKNENPDIVFSFATNFVRLYMILNSIKWINNAKIVLFFADDVTVKTKKGLFHNIHWKLGQKYLQKCIDLSSCYYGITPTLCTEYQQKFKKPFKLLRKGCDLSLTQVKDSVGDLIRIVYAGNLYYGRDESLIRLIHTIDEINHYDKKVFALEIYSNSIVPDMLRNCITKSSSTEIYGVKPYSEIMKILAESDLVLHIESFKEEAIKYTRLSFSTKITDCMQSGSCLLAIGPGNVASMEEINQIPGAISITDIDDLQQTLEDVAKNPSQLIQRANAIQKHALENFSVKMVRESLQSDFQNLIGKDKDTLKERTY